MTRTTTSLERRLGRAVPAALLVLAAFAPPALAQPAQPAPPPPPADTPAAPVIGVSLPAALAQATAHAPDALVAIARVGQSEAEVGVAGMIPNPNVRVGTLTAPARWQGSITFNLPVFGQLGAAMNAAEAGAEAARNDVTRVRLDVRLATASAWTDLWLAERQAETLAADDARRQRLLTVAQERFTAGSAPQLDVFRARAEAARSRAEVAASALAVGGMARRLGLLLGTDPRRAPWLRAAGTPADAPGLPPLASLLARLGSHPLYAVARARVHEADARVSLEERLRLPNVGLDLGVDEWAGDLQGPPSGMIGVSMDVPLFHNHGALIRRAEAARIALDVERSTTLTRLAADLAAAYADFQGAALRARALVEDVLPVTQQAADLAVEAYQAGRGDIQAVIAAEQSLSDARLAAAQAVAGRGTALARLETALGGPL